MRLQEAKKERIISLISGIFCSLLGSYVTGFGGFIAYLAVRSGIKGDEIKDVIVLAVLGAGILLLSFFVWKAAIKELKKSKQLKRYIAENEDKQSRSEIMFDERGRMMFEGIMALAVAVFGILWTMQLWDAGAWWFAAIGGIFIVILPCVVAVYNLKEAFQSVPKQQDAAADAPQFSSEKGKRGRILWTLVLGVMAIYDVIRFAEVFSHGISEKELPIFILFNMILTLGIIVRVKNDLKQPNGNR